MSTFTCSGGNSSAPDICTPICGDGIIVSPEICDDNNTNNSDGCTSNCLISHGWYCLIPGSPCVSNCSDGLVSSIEACDDSNLDPDDGCSPVCTIEYGFSCPTEGVSC